MHFSFKSYKINYIFNYSKCNFNIISIAYLRKKNRALSTGPLTGVQTKECDLRLSLSLKKMHGIVLVSDMSKVQRIFKAKNLHAVSLWRLQTSCRPLTPPDCYGMNVCSTKTKNTVSEKLQIKQRKTIKGFIVSS